MNRKQTHAHCHRQEERTTPGGETRYTTVNANRHEDGTITRDATATTLRDEEHEMLYRQEERTTTERPGSDMVYEARIRRTNWMAHNHPEA